MDPQAALKRIHAAWRDDDLDLLVPALADLLGWLRGGGLTK